MLSKFEKQFNMSTEDFLKLRNMGKSADTFETNVWSSLYMFRINLIKMEYWDGEPVRLHINQNIVSEDAHMAFKLTKDGFDENKILDVLGIASKHGLDVNVKTYEITCSIDYINVTLNKFSQFYKEVNDVLLKRL
jgi:hypothetical protein